MFQYYRSNRGEFKKMKLIYAICQLIVWAYFIYWLTQAIWYGIVIEIGKKSESGYFKYEAYGIRRFFKKDAGH